MSEIYLKLAAMEGIFSERDFDRLLDLTLNGIEISPRSEETPSAWDMSVEATHSDIILEGHVGPSGFGSCTIEFPKGAVDKLYTFTVVPRENASLEELFVLLGKYGITRS